MPEIKITLPPDRNQAVNRVLEDVEFRNQNGVLLISHRIDGNQAVLTYEEPPVGAN